MSTRTSSRKISASIAKLAAQDLLVSDDEIMDDRDVDVDVDLTLVASDGAEQDETHGDGKGQHEEEESQDSEEGESQEEDEDDEGDNEVDESENESENGVEEEEEDDSDDGEKVVVPKKRKRSGSGKNSTAPPAHEIEYKVAIFTAAQMKKKTSARGHPVTEIVTLLSNKPWAVLNTQILTKIDAVLNPRLLNFSDYSITFTVPRQVSEPIRLDATKYEYLVKKALLIKKNPRVKIIVEPKESGAGEKETDTTGDEETKKGGKKTKVGPQSTRYIPGNVALNEKIGELATQPDHLPLSHEQFQSWGAAALKGTAFADLETPPNNKLFDSVAAGARAAQSPLLQRRLELQQQAAAKTVPSVPQVNINFPAEFANFLCPAAPAPAPVAPNASILPPNITNMLIPYPEDLSIQDFCSLYSLDDDICDRFQTHKYKRTKSFKFIEVDELKEIGFLQGEIAELKVAVAQWSQPANAE
ncbi:hypothetical protein B0H13DRAFT_2305561 [Mycena leptocephala]|nr:hypothetical protein B0H13DRAFT_2305561 [Mycena leptocephala]